MSSIRPAVSYRNAIRSSDACLECSKPTKILQPYTQLVQCETSFSQDELNQILLSLIHIQS